MEYLKHAPISDEHKAALDDIEDDFYADLSGVRADKSRNSSRKGSAVGGNNGVVENGSGIMGIGYGMSGPGSVTGAGGTSGVGGETLDQQSRMRRRLTAVLREKSLPTHIATQKMAAPDVQVIDKRILCPSIIPILLP